jgi:hypothetical protein
MVSWHGRAGACFYAVVERMLLQALQNAGLAGVRVRAGRVASTIRHCRDKHLSWNCGSNGPHFSGSPAWYALIEIEFSIAYLFLSTS